jgi:homogentisate 1,2-dioxygenase
MNPTYLIGFGNTFATEAIAGALPTEQNSPQRAPLGLYPEQLSATAFAAPRAENRFSWLYRGRPSVAPGRFARVSHAGFDDSIQLPPAPPDALRWSPLAMGGGRDFLDGLHIYARNDGGTVMGYAADQSMVGRYFYSADGEWLIVPQQGTLRLITEFGTLDVPPLHIAVIPRGVRYRVILPDGPSRGYVCENAGELFRLPDLGPIGANGLAHPRHFETPVAAYEASEGEVTLVAKFDGVLWTQTLPASPINVVAWHGNLAPYRYDLTRFNTINTVSYDHPDPSIFTVLTSPTTRAGTANIDFVIFPPRWMVAEHTFRPPYFHRNVMSEFMGLIQGIYDAKEEGFVPGGASLHNCMTPHGPDFATFEKASAATLTPARIEATMAFMFESSHIWRPTSAALASLARQLNYADCWAGFPLSPGVPR